MKGGFPTILDSSVAGVGQVDRQIPSPAEGAAAGSRRPSGM
jgi:hypothetical protein